MKLKPTPLLLTSSGFFIYGVWMWIFSERSIQGYEILFALGSMAVGFVGLCIYFILRFFFREKLWTQILIEAFVIATFFVWSYLS